MTYPWLNPATLKACVSPVTWQWLTDPGPLTPKLNALSDETLLLQLQFSGWKEIPFSERLCLETSPHERCWIREIVFYGHEKPWEWARTIIPESSLTGRLKAIQTLEDTPLGSLLFHEKSVRSSLTFARLSPDMSFFESVKTFTHTPQHTWIRRSLFYVEKNPLLLYECFLAALLEAME